MLVLLFALVHFAATTTPVEYENPILGYKGPKTPSCVDGTLYATSRSQCAYPSDAIQFWVRQNWIRAQALFKSVPVYAKPPTGVSFPNAVDGKEQCNYVEDYPLIQWVYSVDLGWVPVVQVEEYKQYFRLESCTSSKCAASGSVCQTFQIRARIIVWNGKEVVSTIALLPDACKCVLDSDAEPSHPIEPIPIHPIELPLPKPDEDNGRIIFESDEDSDDSDSSEEKGRRRVHHGGRFYRRRPYRRFTRRQPRCNPYKDCWCPCRSERCEQNKQRIKNCANDLYPCNPYIDCRCPCPYRDLKCVHYRKKNSPCRDNDYYRGYNSRSRSRSSSGSHSGSREHFKGHHWW